MVALCHWNRLMGRLSLLPIVSSANDLSYHIAREAGLTTSGLIALRFPAGQDRLCDVPLDRTVGEFESCGDLVIGTTVEAVEQEDLARPVRQSRDRGLYPAQALSRRDDLVWLDDGRHVLVFGDRAKEPNPTLLRAEMADRGIADGLRQIGRRGNELLLGARPNGRKDILYDIGSIRTSDLASRDTLQTSLLGCVKRSDFIID